MRNGRFMDATRRDLFGILAALGGLPLIAKEIEAPKRLILDPGEVVRFDSLATGVRIGGWGGTAVARIPVTRRAADRICAAGFGRFVGFTVEIKPAHNGQSDTVTLDYDGEMILVR
jgi:hypothetical protein